MSCNEFKAICFGFALVGFTGGVAVAQTFDVKQIEATKGSIEYGPESMFAKGVPHAIGSDLNRHANEQAIFYGIADWWKISGALKLEKPEDDEFRATAVSLGNLFVVKALDEKRSVDVGLGWYTEIAGSVHRDSTNSVLFGPIVTLKAEKVAFTVNPFLEQTFGRHHEEGIALNYGWQAKYEVRNGFAIGIEGFGVIDNLGDAPPWSEQEHRIGPVAFTELPLGGGRNIGVDIGVLFGLTPSTPDAALKLNFNVPLYQPPGKAD